MLPCYYSSSKLADFTTSRFNDREICLMVATHFRETIKHISLSVYWGISHKRRTLGVMPKGDAPKFCMFPWKCFFLWNGKEARKQKESCLFSEGIPSFKVKKDSTKTCPVQKLQKSIRHTKFHYLELPCMMMYHRIYTYTYTYIHIYIYDYLFSYFIGGIDLNRSSNWNVYWIIYCPFGIAK